MHKINYKVEEVKSSQIPVDKQTFYTLCKNGCKVFGTKWSCPPISPTFNPSKNACIIILWMTNSVESKNEYTKIKAVNSILKSKLYKLLYQYSNTHTFGSGSCRLCQKCQYPESCKRPDKMIYSMESIGINVNLLCKSLGHTLQWYKKGEKYEYGSVVGMILDGDKPKIERQLNTILNPPETNKIKSVDNIITI